MSFIYYLFFIYLFIYLSIYLFIYFLFTYRLGRMRLCVNFRHSPTIVLKALNKTKNYHIRIVGLKESIWTRDHLNTRNVSDILYGEFMTSYLKLIFDVTLCDVSKYGQPYIKDSYIHLLPPHLGSTESGRSSHFLLFESIGHVCGWHPEGEYRLSQKDVIGMPDGHTSSYKECVGNWHKTQLAQNTNIIYKTALVSILRNVSAYNMINP
jgi:hypothetical protein